MQSRRHGGLAAVFTGIVVLAAAQAWPDSQLMILPAAGHTSASLDHQVVAATDAFAAPVEVPHMIVFLVAPSRAPQRRVHGPPWRHRR